MVCTTNFNLIPEDKHPKKKEEPTPNSNVIGIDPLYSVFEKDNGWRSFRLSQLTSFPEIQENNND